MQMPLQVTFHGIERSDALDARIRECAAKLDDLHSRITSCRVAVSGSNRHQQQGRQFHVTVDLRLPGAELVASQDHAEDVYVALRDAFDAIKRQLEDVVRQQRGQVKSHGHGARGQSPGA